MIRWMIVFQWMERVGMIEVGINNEDKVQQLLNYGQLFENSQEFSSPSLASSSSSKAIKKEESFKPVNIFRSILKKKSKIQHHL